MYNLEEATKAFIQSAAYLARDLDFDSDNPPTEKQVASWRSSAMMIVAQHKAAHKEITALRQRVAELEDQITELPWSRLLLVDITRTEDIDAAIDAAMGADDGE